MTTTNVHEISDGVFRLSTFIPEAAPGGLTFNQFLITGEEPVLFHTGPRQMYPLVSDALAKVVPLETLSNSSPHEMHNETPCRSCSSTGRPPGPRRSGRGSRHRARP
ncbi:MAG: hypothetical protein ACFCVK_19555 [Acidimicrobiales bacterium]